MTLKRQVEYIVEKFPDSNLDDSYKNLLKEFYSGLLWCNTLKNTYSISVENLWKLPRLDSFTKTFRSLK